MGAYEGAIHGTLAIAYIAAAVVLPAVGPRGVYAIGAATGLLSALIMVPLLRVAHAPAGHPASTTGAAAEVVAEAAPASEPEPIAVEAVPAAASPTVLPPAAEFEPPFKPVVRWTRPGGSRGTVVSNTYDAIVIGGGHNGLVAAAYLAKAGARVVVCEARHKTGGAAATDQPWPDHPEFKVTTLSYVMSLMPDTIVRDLRLERHGYRVHPVGPYVVPLPDGRAR